MDGHALQELNQQMARLADGDRSACTSVFTLLWPPLVAFAERALGTGPDADDAAQQALEKIFAQAPSYDAGRSALAWALAITAFECRTVLASRRRRREHSLEAGREFPATAPTPEEEVVMRTLIDALDVALAELSEQDRRTLKQAFLDPADAGKANEVTFRKRKQRAIERLRTTWRKLYGS